MKADTTMQFGLLKKMQPTSVTQTNFIGFLALSLRQSHIEIHPDFQTWVVFSESGVEKWNCCHASDYLLWNLACLNSWNCFCKNCASENGRNELLSQECWFAQHSDILPSKAAFVFKGCRLTQIRIFSKPSNTSCQLLT